MKLEGKPQSSLASPNQVEIKTNKSKVKHVLTKNKLMLSNQFNAAKSPNCVKLHVASGIFLLPHNPNKRILLIIFLSRKSLSGTALSTSLSESFYAL